MNDFPMPHSEKTEGAWTRTLVDDWEWRYTLRGQKYRIFVPQGVEYDPSIPTVAESFMPEDRLFAASLPHDVLYKLKGDLRRPDYPILSSCWHGKWHRRNTVSRLYADLLFYKITEETGVSWWRRQLAWHAIRSRFGKAAWDEVDDFTLPKKLY